MRGRVYLDIQGWHNPAVGMEGRTLGTCSSDLRDPFGGNLSSHTKIRQGFLRFIADMTS